jgi:hypothetical protein
VYFRSVIAFILMLINERFCKACKEKVEDEHHFLIECPIYNSVRDKFFTLFNRKFNETTEVTINRLLNPSSSQDLNNICLYLKESYSLRDSTFNIFNFPQVTGKNFQMIIIILILFNYYTPKMIINIMILIIII